MSSGHACIEKGRGTIRMSVAISSIWVKEDFSFDLCFHEFLFYSNNNKSCFCE